MTFHLDALGSPVVLTNDVAVVAASYMYDPFGKTTIAGFSTNPFQFTGRENDGTGLFYYRARYYHPRLQRFLSEDPIAFGGGLNFYAYANNSPNNFVDPLGLFGAIKNPSIEIALGADGTSLMLKFDVDAPPGTEVTIDVGSKTVFEENGNFTNEPFNQLSSGNQTGIANELGIATFEVDITNTPGYIQIKTPGLSDIPTTLTGPVDPGAQLAPCKYTCKSDKSYDGPPSTKSSGGGR